MGPSPEWDAISEEAKDLVRVMLTIDPKKRITAREVATHPWILKKSPNPLQEATESLRKYNASRRLKKAALGIMAEQRVAKALVGLGLGLMFFNNKALK